MPNRSVDDDGKAFDHLDLGANRTGLGDFESHYVSDNTRLASDDEQVLVMSPLDDDITQDAQDALRGGGDIEPGIASATGHLGLKSASSDA